jgi:hypothetical protein
MACSTRERSVRSDAQPWRDSYARPIDTAPPVIIDRNWGRPPRVNQWTVSLQREVLTNLTVEAAYVANRGNWLNAPALGPLNVISQERCSRERRRWEIPGMTRFRSR